MAFSDRDFISKEKHELDYVLRKWGKKATEPNRAKLAAALDRFRDDKAYEPFTRDRFYDYAEKTGLPRTLEAAEGKETGPEAGEAAPSSPGGKKLPWWLIALLVVLILVLAFFLLRSCGGRAQTGSPNASVSSAASAPAAAQAQAPARAAKVRLSLDSIPKADLVIRFLADSAEPAPGEALKLEALAAALKALDAGEGVLVVIGHAAGIGYPAGELAVSRARADFVAKRLREAGLAAGIGIEAEGRGASEPLPGPASASRRVEIGVK